MSGFTIGRLAKAAQVRIDTIRFYEKLGLLSPQRRASGFREYSEYDLERLVFIRQARTLGFSLDEISRLLLPGTDAIDDLGSIVDSHLRAIDQKIEALRSWRGALLEWQRESERGSPNVASLVRGITATGGQRRPTCVAGCNCADPRAC